MWQPLDFPESDGNRISKEKYCRVSSTVLSTQRKMKVLFL